MTTGITTSFRLTPEVRQRLDHAAQVLHRGRNWIINEALERYLKQLNHKILAEEARKQSLAACQSDVETETAVWFENSDKTGWV